MQHGSSSKISRAPRDARQRPALGAPRRHLHGLSIIRRTAPGHPHPGGRDQPSDPRPPSTQARHLPIPAHEGPLMASNLSLTYAAVKGQFAEAIKDMQKPIAKAGTAAIRDLAVIAKTKSRAVISSAGFGKRWQNALRVDVYP